MDNVTIKLIQNIESTESVEKLEMTISMLLFGWVIDDNNKSEYENLIEISQNRLKVLMIIKGDDHPLTHINMKTDKDRIERVVLKSLMNGIVNDERKRDVLFDMVSMN